MSVLFNLITCLTILQATIFSLIFIFNKKRNVSLILLGIYLITIVGPGLHFLLANFNIKARFEFPTNFYLLSPPIFYLYTKSVLGLLSKKDSRHLILGIIEFFFYILLFYFPSELAEPYYRYFLLPNKLVILTVFLPIYSVSYLLASIYLLNKCNFRVQEFYTSNEQKRLKWIYITNIISIFLYVLDTVTTFMSVKHGFQINIFLISTIAIAFIVYWISIYGMNQKSLILDLDDEDVKNKMSTISDELPGLEHFNEENFKQVKMSDKALMENIETLPLNNTENNSLNDDYALKYQKIVAFFEATKIYKDKEINLFKVADLLQMPYKDISKVINRCSEKNFNQFLNEFRINEAKRLIKNNDFEKYNLNWIAEEVGFNSRSTFFAVFKSLVGMTPNEFKNI
jgi:AraC-like DNA-binding protein